MKKLLVMMLVLALASVANAGLSFDVPGAVNGEITISVSDILTIGVTSDGSGAGGLGQYDALLVNTNLAGGVWVQGSGTIAGPPQTREDAYIVIDNDVVVMGNIQPDTLQLEPGLGFTVDFHCIADGENVVILLLDPSVGDTPVDVLTIYQIPEPMTIALLGLGGLFLRRRKK